MYVACLTQFLTFRPEHAPEQELDVWAQVCDQTHYLPARFTSAAVDAFQNASPMRFTQLRGAVIAVHACRLRLAQVQVQCAGSPWTPDSPPTMVLDVDKFAILGGIGEPPHPGVRDAMQ